MTTSFGLCIVKTQRLPTGVSRWINISGIRSACARTMHNIGRLPFSGLNRKWSYSEILKAVNWAVWGRNDA
jgi:hypothetical protein